ncbi:hypothetical protein [Olleya namhaensis]|uniref:hypothetical protein n=1 Tax=Olleya namhaensis TaxID=1144750 RepID=UPI00232F99B3|nr:hypothetical protein [Olleya namhaensis]
MIDTIKKIRTIYFHIPETSKKEDCVINYFDSETGESYDSSIKPKIKIDLELNKEIYIPLFLLELNNDWDILLTIAILNYEKPNIEYYYFEIGEKYNASHTVHKEETILKELGVFLKKEKLSINDYIERMKKIHVKDQYEKVLDSFFKDIHSENNTYDNDYDEPSLDEMIGGDEQMQDWYNSEEMN